MTPPAAATAAARHPARTTRPAPGPRRVSGPARRAGGARVVPRPARRQLPLGARVLDWVRALPDHRLLDRLIGGRVWIALIGTLLVGIVTLQLSLLKLNAGIGRAVERGAALEQGNATLRAEISRLSDPQRITDIATREGFVQPVQGTPVFLTASAGDARRALSVMRVPQQSATTSVSTTLAATTLVTPAADTTTTSDPAATTADPTAAAGTITSVRPATTDQTATSGAATTAPAAPTDAVTAGTTAAGGAAAPQG